MLTTKKGNKMKSIIKKFCQESNHVFSCLIAGLLIATILNSYVCQTVEVSGSSMEPTFHDGNRLLMEKISYRFHYPKRFDIIVFPRNGNYFLIKRIIGMPNETVFISSMGEIFIDGQLLEDKYGKEKISDAGLAGRAVTLGDNEYFVLGDNRNDSLDSRSERVGNVRIEDILGKIMR